MTDEEWDNIAFGDRIYSHEISQYAEVRGVIQDSLKGITGVRVKWEHIDENRTINRLSVLGALMLYIPDSIRVYERLRKEDP